MFKLTSDTIKFTATNKKTLRYILTVIFIFFLHFPLFSQKNKIDSLLDSVRTFLYKSMPDNAIPLLFEVMELSSDENTSVYANINLAEAYREKQEYKKGTDILYLVLENENITPKNKAYAYNRMAALYDESKNTNRIDSTVKYSELSIEISKKNGFNNYLASSQNELCYIYNGMQEYDKALEYGQNALSLFLGLKMYPEAINTSINIAGIYLNINKIQKSKKIIETTMTLLPEDDFKNLYMRVYLRLSDIYTAEKNYEKAFYYVSKARVLQENFYEKRINSKINEMSAKYDLKLKEQEISKIQQKAKIQQQQKIFLSIILLILSLTLFILIVNSRLKKKIRRQKEKITAQENIKLKSDLKLKENELKYKNKELSEALTNVISFNEVLRKIAHHVKNGKNNDALKVVISNLSSNYNWEKFKLSFNEVYPAFFNTLSKAYPDLTENETKLCAFLMMEMKTLEIASLMNITDSSVSKNRNRLRKKLNLENGADISAFLKSL